jgi:hypothetical protein
MSEIRKSPSIADLLAAAEATTKKKTFDNDRIETWSCSMDKLGNGQATIRFLPAPKGEALPWAKIQSFGFKNEGTGRWYIENCLLTIGQNDPMVEFNNGLYNTKDPEKIEQAKKQKRKTNYYCNVLIVNDPAKPELNGSVVMFRFGQKIFDKLMAAMKPNNEGLDPDDWTDPINPFGIDDGANFTVKIKKVAGYANFDDSSFGKVKPLAKTDAEVESILSQAKSLTALTAPDKFKSYEALTKRIAFVLGLDGGDTNRAPAQPTRTAAAVAIADEIEAESKLSVSDDDSDSDYFRSLASDD